MIRQGTQNGRRRRRFVAGTGAAALLVVGAQVAGAHDSVPVVPEVWPGTARLLVVDNAASQLLTVDLPDATVTTRTSLPPKTLVFGVSDSGRYAVAIRGRDTDRQFVSVLATGVEADGLRRPYIAKTLLLGAIIGGLEDGRLTQLWGRDVLIAEATGTALRFDEEALAPTSAFVSEPFALGLADHTHLVPDGDAVWVQSLGNGAVRRLDRDGAELSRLVCPVGHGAAEDPGTGRAFFACVGDVLAVADGAQLARIPYPGTERIGTFLHGDGVLFGLSDGVTAVQVLDPSALTLRSVPLNGTAIGSAVSADGSRLFVLLTSGALQIRSGTDGRLLRQVNVGPAFPELDETTAAAIMPDMVARGDQLYVSLPHKGRLVEVDWRKGCVTRTVKVGGMPTRLAVVEAAGS